MLKRIKIENYKSFRSVEIRPRGITVIMGPNAAGKSNFLDAIHLVCQIVNSRNLRDAFAGHRGVPLESFFYGDRGFEALLRRERVTCSFEVDIELSPSTIAEVNRIAGEKRKGLEPEDTPKQYVSERFLRYRVVIEALPKTGVLRIEDEELLAVRQRDWQPKESRQPFVEKMEMDRTARLHLRMEGQAHPTYFQIGLDHAVVSTALYEPHYPHMVAFRKELEQWKTYCLEPKELIREDVPLAEVGAIGPGGENLAAFMNTLKQKSPEEFDNLNRAIQQILPDKPRIDVVPSKEGLVGLKLVENDLSFSARLLSEGTLRVLGLVAALHPANPATLVGYEEPENGVDPRRLRQIAELFKNAAEIQGKQFVITTHSPLFAEFFEGENLLVCEKRGHESALRPFIDRGPLYRRQAIETALTGGTPGEDVG